MFKAIFILLVLLSLELIAVFYFYFDGNECGSYCDPYGFLNPFGYIAKSNEISSCIETCVYTPHPFFYLFGDIFIVTLSIFIFCLFLRRYRSLKDTFSSSADFD